MKKILYILFACSLAFVSCTDDLGTQQEIPADTIVLNVFNSPMTKAEYRDGDEYERQLNRLDVFFYEEGATDEPCVYYLMQEVDAIGQEEINLSVTEFEINAIFKGKNTCEVFVIANLPDYVTRTLTNGKYAAGAEGTDVNTLSQIILTLGGEHDAVNKPFVMAGLGQAEKGEDNNASGEIPLYRAASKVTLTVTVPQEIEAADGVVMVPVFEAKNALNELESTLKTAFHNGATKTCLNTAYTGENTLFSTPSNSKVGFTKSDSMTSDGKHIFTCDVPFYTYARSWEKGSQDAAYLTLELMWVAESERDNAASYKPYYYQVLINGAGRCFEPNHWYDLTVNIGVLGSTVEFDPKTINDLTYYILDWTTEPESDSGDRYENVDIHEYAYLVVPETYIELNNVSTAEIKYNASHKIGIQMNTASKDIEIIGGTTTNSSYYINCSTNPPQIAKLSLTAGSATSSANIKPAVDENGDQNGVITYNYTIPSNVYSPVFVYATVWLDIDGDGIFDANTDEAEFVEEIEIVQYPAIYITPDPSTLRSIYVNGTQSHDSSMDNVRLDDYYLGASTGVKNFSDNNARINNSMYVINVSALNSTNVFYAPDVNTSGYFDYDNGDLFDPDNPNQSDDTFIKYDYIIGDPRQRDNALQNSLWSRSWANGKDYNGGSDRTLQYYYPTENQGNSFQIIAPKYRIVSFNNASGKNCTPESAAMRCASVQEDGYPAGRWRLPTVAEVQFVIDLQRKGQIVEIFLSTGSYYATASYASGNQLVTLRQNGDNIQWNKVASGISVRCVYDEWYWGSEKDAVKNSTPTWKNTDNNNVEHVGDEYLFTWGDKQIW